MDRRTTILAFGLTTWPAMLLHSADPASLNFDSWLRSVEQSLTIEAPKTLVHASVGSRLGYCNSILVGVSGQLLHKLQVIQELCGSYHYRYRYQEVRASEASSARPSLAASQTTDHLQDSSAGV